MGTQEYYATHGERLLQEYRQADMSTLHKLLKTHIPPHSKVLDIGFGAMRELEYLHSLGHDIWGVDATELFVSYAKQNFPEIKEHFLQAALPFKEPLPLPNDFDAIISIALWMHLKQEQYADAIRDITSLLDANKGVIVLSFSTGSRSAADERYFEEVDIEYLDRLLQQHGLHLIEKITTEDSLKRNTLSWITLVYRHD